MLKTAVIILVCAVPVGWLLGTGWERRTASGSTASAKPVDTSPGTGRVREAPRGNRLGKKEIIDLMRERSSLAATSGFSPMADVLADWRDAEVIAALEQSISDPAAHGLPGESGNVTIVLLLEWLKRDEGAALKWFGGLESMRLKGQLAPTMAGIWLPDRAEEGMAFLLANRDVYRFGHAEDFVRTSLNAAGAKGADSVNGLLRIAREGDLTVSRVVLGFPPDFDFSALAAGGELKLAVEKNPANPVLLAWAKQDRDAAFRWTMENLGGAHVAEQILGTPNDGGPIDKEWAAARYEEMDESQRSALMESVGNFYGRYMDLIPGFSPAIQDEQLREDLRMRGVQGIFTGKTRVAAEVLNQLGPPERRLEILENLERAPVETPPVPLDETRLRELLGRWTEDQQRIEAIISRLKS